MGRKNYGENDETELQDMDIDMDEDEQYVAETEGQWDGDDFVNEGEFDEDAVEFEEFDEDDDGDY